MILVDTSAWVDYLRGADSTATGRLRELLGTAPETVATCEPVAMELLAGAAEHQVGPLERLVNGLPVLPLDPSVDFRSAAVVYRAARRSGRTVRSTVDCLIAAVAIRHQVPVLHRDADYEVIADVTALQHESCR